ncbi:MAG TPA: cytochrome c biogenesis protein CcdA [Alphaproteobacteria bacterium]|jgi:cytochrome c-type biogenesis protein|nr:cytochrome c biogenesis protein CcdA [Alphaproteobacteria bacterium]
MLDISYAGAVGGGLLSFLSPCVLPLVPAYLCFLGGVSVDELTAGAGKGAAAPAGQRRVLLAAFAFVLGFSTVFVALGASASAVSQVLLSQKLLLGKIAGVVIILFGLHFMGLLRIPALNREARFHWQDRPAGPLGAFLIGLAFAFGWTPCIGPVLATVLSVAARQDSVAYGVTLLASYAAGLGIPFVLAALAAGPFMRWLQRMRRHMHKIELATGGLLVLTGLLFLFNSFEVIGFWLIETFPALGNIG